MVRMVRIAFACLFEGSGSSTSVTSGAAAPIQTDPWRFNPLSFVDKRMPIIRSLRRPYNSLV